MEIIQQNLIEDEKRSDSSSKDELFKEYQEDGFTIEHMKNCLNNVKGLCSNLIEDSSDLDGIEDMGELVKINLASMLRYLAQITEAIKDYSSPQHLIAEIMPKTWMCRVGLILDSPENYLIYFDELSDLMAELEADTHIVKALEPELELNLVSDPAITPKFFLNAALKNKDQTENSLANVPHFKLVKDKTLNQILEHVSSEVKCWLQVPTLHGLSSSLINPDLKLEYLSKIRMNKFVGPYFHDGQYTVAQVDDSGQIYGWQMILGKDHGSIQEKIGDQQVGYFREKNKGDLVMEKNMNDESGRIRYFDLNEDGSVSTFWI